MDNKEDLNLNDVEEVIGIEEFESLEEEDIDYLLNKIEGEDNE